MPKLAVRLKEPVSAKKRWTLNGFQKLRETRKKGFTAPVTDSVKKIETVRRIREKELCTLISGLSEEEARALLSRAHRTILLNGPFFTELMKEIASRIRPEELRPEYFSVHNFGELIDLCNRHPKLRFARFFEEGKNQRVRVRIGNETYSGNVQKIDGEDVFVIIDYSVENSGRMLRSYYQKREPFVQRFKRTSINLTLFKKGGERKGPPKGKDLAGLLAKVLGKK